MNNIICGDCLSVLKTMPAESVNCCITSPPYWGLRDYGVAGQLGLEKTPEEYVAHMVEVFREVRRVLKDDGTLWLNLGDSYSSTTKGDNRTPEQLGKSDGLNRAKDPNKSHVFIPMCSGVRRVESGPKPKDLVGIPWRVAFALQADGWYLRQDIIWAKPNPMPESVTDRCTKAHEYIFLLAKSARYYYDADAIKEDSCVSDKWNEPNAKYLSKTSGNGETSLRNGFNRLGEIGGTRNRRSVWTVATKPSKEAHFAMFPPDLIEPMILAGCPEDGVILDPFIGAGTTGMVAKQNYRNYIGIELNPANVRMSNRRIDGTLVNKKLTFGESK